MSRNKDKITKALAKKGYMPSEMIWEPVGHACEMCGHRVAGGGYDDANFHDNVIPSMRCPKCGKTSAECGADYRPLTTKYPEGYQI